MQDEDFDFIGHAVAQPSGILAGNFKTDGNVSSLMAGKGEHVRGFVFVAKTPVQRVHFAPGGDEDGNVTFHPCHDLGAPRKALQSDRIDDIRFAVFSIEDDHSSQKQSGRAKRPSRKHFTKLLLQRRFLRFLSFLDRTRQFQCHLLVARLLIISANDPLHQMMPDDILFSEVIK